MPVGKPLKPTSVLLMEKGALYGEQKARAELEPKPVQNLKPRCPRHFRYAEKREWKFIAGIAENYGLLHIANAGALERLASNRVKRLELGRMVEKDGLIILNARFQPVIHPAQKLISQLEQQERADEQLIGFNSEGLAKLGSLQAKKKSKTGLEALMD